MCWFTGITLYIIHMQQYFQCNIRAFSFILEINYSKKYLCKMMKELVVIHNTDVRVGVIKRNGEDE